MTLPAFDANEYLQGDIFSETFPQSFGAADESMEEQMAQGGPMDASGGQTAQQQGGDHQMPQEHGGQTGSMGDSGVQSPTPSAEEGEDRSFNRRFTVATGYVATGLLALTLLIGPANLLLGKRNPVSSYLRRDVGTWTAIASVVHTIFGLLVHGSGEITSFLDYFVVDGSPLTNSFGLANWTGLAALVIVLGLFALSNDVSLRKLKARSWKRLQRLNYALFALVLVHAFFYGALLRLDSPLTLMLLLIASAVFVGQVMGVRLWRRKHARTAASQPA